MREDRVSTWMLHLARGFSATPAQRLGTSVSRKSEGNSERALNARPVVVVVVVCV